MTQSRPSSTQSGERGKRLNTTVRLAHMALVCQDPLRIESFYSRHFGFRRARVYEPGPDQVVMIKSGDVRLELFPATETSSAASASGAGPEYPGWRHLAFQVDDVDAKLAEMGNEAKITLGPQASKFIPGMRVVWLADPEGNILELNHGYTDEKHPPPET